MIKEITQLFTYAYVFICNNNNCDNSRIFSFLLKSYIYYYDAANKTE